MEDAIHLLIIEDNPADRRLIGIFLKEAYGGSLHMTCSEFLSEGLDILRQNSFDVIILDLSLPDSTGLDTFIAVHKADAQTPIIVLTGLDDESVGRNAMKMGAQDFLIKGKLKSKGLRRSINYSIERNKLHKQLSEYSRKLEEQAENLLREKRKLTEAQKMAHIGSWELNLQKNRLTWSEEMYRLFGVPSDKDPPSLEAYYKLIHPDDLEMLKLAISDSFEKRTPLNLHHRILRADRAIRIFHTQAEVIGNRENESVFLVGTSQDLTEQLQKEYMEKLVLAATQSFNSVVIRDRKGRIEWVNEGFTKLSGYTLEDVKGSLGDALKKDKESALLLQNGYHERILRYKTPVSYESENCTKSGTVFWTITTLTPILGEDGEVERIVSIDSDITIRKQMEEDLQLANRISEHSLLKGNKALLELGMAKKELEESMKVKELFLANMSHEIRTPMNAIIGFTDLLLKTELSDEFIQYVNAIKISGENLMVIINDILDFSKIQNGKIFFESIPLDLPNLLKTLVQLLLPKATEKGITLDLELDQQIPPQLLGDPTRITQILLNLVGNAIKFTKAGGVDIKVMLISASDVQARLRFSVKDTGIGIPQDKLPTIFESFSQAENNTTRKYGGTGLGLTISKQLVELQHGTISVESTENAGTLFTFELDFRIGTGYAEQAAPSPAAQKAGLPELKNLSVLLVEDNYLNQVLAAKVLRDWDWHVEIAENGLLALEKLNQRNFDVVLMDIQLPELDGYEASRRIRNTLPSEKSNVPIIAMTAHALVGEAEKCLEAGMNDYISKPFNPDVLYSKIVNAVVQHDRV